MNQVKVVMIINGMAQHCVPLECPHKLTLGAEASQHPPYHAGKHGIKRLFHSGKRSGKKSSWSVQDKIKIHVHIINWSSIEHIPRIHLPSALLGNLDICC